MTEGCTYTKKNKFNCVGFLITTQFRFITGRALMLVLSKAFHFYEKITNSNHPGVSMTRKMVSVTICTDKRRQTRPQTSRLYHSALAPFYHIRSRERAKYATVSHSKIVYCTAKSRFHRFSGRRTEKDKF